MSQFILAEVLVLNLYKIIHLHIWYNKTQQSCEISISKLDRSGEVVQSWMEASLIPVPAREGRIPSCAVAEPYYVKGCM